MTAFAGFWGVHISAEKPKLGREPFDEQHLTAMMALSTQQTNTLRHLLDVLNHTQLQNRCSAQCSLRAERADPDGPKLCRFCYLQN
jgi:hypothetical protein